MKHKVTRKQLQEIYNIACEGWKKKIEKLAQETFGSFGDEGEISQEMVQSMYDAATTHNGIDQKKVVESIFPRPKSIDDQITDYESSCKLIGMEALKLEDFVKIYGEVKGKKAFAQHKVETGIEAINEGWLPDFDDSTQYKYWIYRYNKDKKPLLDVGSYLSTSDVGSALLIKSSQKAERIKEVFEKDYLEFM